MRRLTSVLAVLILLLAALGATPTTTARERAQAPANLVTNPGFEDGTYDPGGSPPGWITMPWQPLPMTWDSAVAHSGSYSVKIDASTAPNDASWVQHVTVTPNTLYRFSAWVRTEGVGHTAEIDDAGANLTAYGGALQARSPSLFGTNDWTRLDFTFNSGEATSVELMLRLGYWAGTCTGTVWFDDVELVPLTWSDDGPHPSWKFLTLIYRTTDFSSTDDAGVAHRFYGALTDDEVYWAGQTATQFVTIDIPALTSGNMVPEGTVRVVDRPLAATRYGDAWWPSPEDTAPERDPAFDSVFVIWQPWVRDDATGEYSFIGAAGGMAYWRGTGQTYASSIAGWVSTPSASRNVFKHEWGHSILFYFDAAGLSPKPPVSNHSDGTEYVHCPTGEPYVWVDEEPGSPIPNSIYNNESGFTHDYYSGTIATADQPARCLGITPHAWAFGGPVTNILNLPPPDEDQPSHAEMAIEDIKEKVNELMDDGVLARERGQPMVEQLDAALQALWAHRPARTVRELRAFNRLVRAAMDEGALPRSEGRPLIQASNAVIAELQQ